MGPLPGLVKSKGGINKCAARFSRHLGRYSQRVIAPSRWGGPLDCECHRDFSISNRVNFLRMTGSLTVTPGSELSSTLAPGSGG